MRRNIRPAHRQAGLSLIELMIALVVGLILMAGVLSIFVSSHRTYGINSAVGLIQENGRFALDFIRRSTRQAGYMGSAAAAANIQNELKPAGGPWPMAFDFGNAITGFEYNGTGPLGTYVITAENPPAAPASKWSPSLDVAIPVIAPDYAIPGSDMLAVRYAQGAFTPIYTTGMAGATVSLTSKTGLTEGELIALSNGVTSYIFQISDVAGASSDIVVNTGASTSPGNQARPADVVSGNQIGLQVFAAPVTEVFYIGQGADGSPALFQLSSDGALASGFDPPQELVPGVENMQILYGVDTTGGGIPSEYDTADVVTAAGNWPNVVSVRVALLLRSATGAVPLPVTAQTYNLLGTFITAPKDTRLRRVFTTTIALRNRLPL